MSTSFLCAHSAVHPISQSRSPILHARPSDARYPLPHVRGLPLRCVPTASLDPGSAVTLGNSKSTAAPSIPSFPNRLSAGSLPPTSRFVFSDLLPRSSTARVPPSRGASLERRRSTSVARAESADSPCRTGFLPAASRPALAVTLVVERARSTSPREAPLLPWVTAHRAPRPALRRRFCRFERLPACVLVRFQRVAHECRSSPRRPSSGRFGAAIVRWIDVAGLLPRVTAGAASRSSFEALARATVGFDALPFVRRIDAAGLLPRVTAGPASRRSFEAPARAASGFGTLPFRCSTAW